MDENEVKLYYREGTTLVSIDRKWAWDGTDWKLRPDLDRLRYWLSYEEADVAANQGGRISGHQRLRLVSREFWLLIGAAASLSGFALCVWLLTQPDISARPVGKAVILGLLAAGLFIYLLIKIWRLLQDLIEGRVVSTKGPLSLLVRDSTWPSLTNGPPAKVCKYVAPNGIEFGIPMKAKDVVPDLVPGKVYFTPRAKRLLSVQLAEGAPGGS